MVLPAKTKAQWHLNHPKPMHNAQTYTQTYTTNIHKYQRYGSLTWRIPYLIMFIFSLISCYIFIGFHVRKRVLCPQMPFALYHHHRHQPLLLVFPLPPAPAPPHRFQNFCWWRARKQKWNEITKTGWQYQSTEISNKNNNVQHDCWTDNAFCWILIWNCIV